MVYLETQKKRIQFRQASINRRFQTEPVIKSIKMSYAFKSTIVPPNEVNESEALTQSLCMNYGPITARLSVPAGQL